MAGWRPIFRALNNQPSSISERRPASTAMAFSLHNHCLCSVGAWSRFVARLIDPRCTQPDHDWDAAVEQFSLLFFLRLLSNKRGAEISQKLHQIVELISTIEGLLQSWSSTALHCRSRLFARESSKFCCLLKQRFNRRQASRHCQETLSKCS